MENGTAPTPKASQERLPLSGARRRAPVPPLKEVRFNTVTAAPNVASKPTAAAASAGAARTRPVPTKSSVSPTKPPSGRPRSSSPSLTSKDSGAVTPRRRKSSSWEGAVDPQATGSRTSIGSLTSTLVTVSPCTTAPNSSVVADRQKKKADKTGKARTTPSPQARAAAAATTAGMPLSRGQLPATTRTPSAARKAPRAAAVVMIAKPVKPTTAGATVTTAATTTTYCDQLEQMESVMDYIDSITQALSRRTQSLPPPDSLTSFRATLMPTTRRAVAAARAGGTHGGFSCMADEEAHYSLLASLHDASNALLSCFSKLEYTRLSADESLPELERGALQSCARVLVVVEKVDRKFTTHEDADIRIAFAERRPVVLACREFVDSLSQAAQQVVLLRRLTAAHELARVCELHSELQQQVARRVAAASSQLSAGYQRRILGGPFFEWLERRWLPAMRAWRRIVLEARRTASAGDVDGALTASRQQALGVDALHEILRGGETVADLHKSQIEGPILELARTFDKKRAVMDALERATEEPTLEGLGKAIQASQDFSRVKSRTQQLSAADGECIAAAQQLLYALQETKVARQAMESALAVGGGGGSSVTLFQPIQRANELILRLDLAQSPVQADRVVRASKAAMSRLAAITEEESSGAFMDVMGGSSVTSAGQHQQGGMTMPILTELLPPTVTTHDLCIAHIPSKVWTVEASTTYQRLCQLLVDVSLREQVRRDLDKANGAINNHGNNGNYTSPHMSSRGGPTVSSSQNDDEDEGGRATTAHTNNSSESSPRQHFGNNTSISSSAAGSPRTAAGGGMTGSAAEIDSLQEQVRRAGELGITGAAVDQARARIAQLNTIRLKVLFQAQTRVIPIADPDATPFEAVYDRLYQDCCEQQQHGAAPEPQRLRVRYEDLDGDFITILNSEDWRMMLSERAPRGARAGTKIEIYCEFPLLPPTAGSTLASPRASGGALVAAATPPVTPPPQQQQRQDDDGRQPRSGPPAIQPVLNTAARLRQWTRQPRAMSPALTVENLVRSQSGYGGGGRPTPTATTPPAAAAGGSRKRSVAFAPPVHPYAARRNDSSRGNPSALIPDGWEGGGGGTPRSSRENSGSAAAAAPNGPVCLNLDNVRRWDDDDDGASRLSFFELQSRASMATAATQPAVQRTTGAPRGVLERATAARLREGHGNGGAHRAASPPSRFTATNCSTQRPPPQSGSGPGLSSSKKTGPTTTITAPTVAAGAPARGEPLSDRRWFEDGEDDGDTFEDFKTMHSDTTRGRASVEYSQGRASSPGPNRTAPGLPGRQLRDRGTAISPPRAPMGLALPPRPDPNRRLGTPNQPRGRRGTPLRNGTAPDSGNGNDDDEYDAAAEHRDPADMLAEMEQMRDQNKLAMRRNTPRRAWH